MADFLLRVDSDLDYGGPLFDLRARRTFRRFRDDMEQEGAEWSLDHIKDTFHRSFKQPTGYYESNVRIRNDSQVWDGGFAGPVYGPWLEGVGSRNNTTRFKGYHAFRDAARALDARFEAMGNRTFRLRYRRSLE